MLSVLVSDPLLQWWDFFVDKLIHGLPRSIAQICRELKDGAINLLMEMTEATQKRCQADQAKLRYYYCTLLSILFLFEDACFDYTQVQPRQIFFYRIQ